MTAVPQPAAAPGARIAYVDTSAFVKRFVQEEGTEHMVAFATEQQWRLGISSLTITEFRSLLKRRLREGSATQAFVHRAIEQLVQEISTGALRFQAVDAPLFNLAAEMIERLESPLGTLDALHLSCAKAMGASLMVSSDRQLLRAAKEAGLTTLGVAAAS